MTPADLLANVDLFGDLTPEELQQLADASTTEDLRRGDVLFHEDDEADTLYVVIEGRIAIAKRSIDGRESVVALMEAGDLFGEMSLFEPLGRSAEARALEPSQVLAIGFAPSAGSTSAAPSCCGAWSSCSPAGASMDEALPTRCSSTSPGARPSGCSSWPGADEFTLPVTQEELAAMVGASGSGSTRPSPASSAWAGSSSPSAATASPTASSSNGAPARWRSRRYYNGDHHPVSR
jgi:hypothetical protein